MTYYTPNHVTKEIGFSFPTSTNAITLGFADTGCWHVAVTRHNIEGSGQASYSLPQGCEGFASPTDPDLIALYLEEEGEMCEHFARYGKVEIQEAIKAAKARNQ